MKWRYISGGVQRSDNERFEICEHGEGWSLRDEEQNAWIEPPYKTQRSAKAAASRLAKEGTDAIHSATH